MPDDYTLPVILEVQVSGNPDEVKLLLANLAAIQVRGDGLRVRGRSLALRFDADARLPRRIDRLRFWTAFVNRPNGN